MTLLLASDSSVHLTVTLLAETRWGPKRSTIRAGADRSTYKDWKTDHRGADLPAIWPCAILWAHAGDADRSREFASAAFFLKYLLFNPF